MNKEQQIKEMAIIVGNCLCEHCEDCKYYNGRFCTYRSMGESEALYNAGYRKVICDRYSFVDLLNEEIEQLKSENEKRLKASEDFATKHCYMKCEIAKTLVKEFSEKLKKRLAKFIWKHNIPECMFNDVMAGLLKEYEK